MTQSCLCGGDTVFTLQKRTSQLSNLKTVFDDDEVGALPIALGNINSPYRVVLWA